MRNLRSNQCGTRAAAALMLLAAAGIASAQTAQEPAIAVIQNLSFAHQGSAGGNPPAAQTIRVYSTPQNLPFTATATTVSGGPWLLVNNGLQISGNTGATGQDVTVSVSPNLPAGQYTGTIAVTSGSTTVNVTVNLLVTVTAVLRLNPASVQVTAETGRTLTLPVTLTSTGVAASWVAEVIARAPAADWLQVFPNFGDAGTQTTLFINTAALPATTKIALGNVRFTSGGAQVTLPITVTITPAAQLVATPTVVTFPFQINATVPTPRAVQVTSSTQTQLGYTATVTPSSAWLTVGTTPSGPGSSVVNGTTPGTLYLIPNLSNVQVTPGTLESTVRLTTPAGGTQDITARLVISTQAQFVLGQNSVGFAYSLGGTVPAAQSLQVGSTSGNLPFTATPEYTTGGQFFTVSPQQGLTPSAMTVSINQAALAGLTAGTYSGNVRITTTASGATENIPVTLTVSGSSLLTIQPPQPPAFEGVLGQPFTERSLQVSSTDGTPQPFTVSTEYVGTANGWLNVSPLSGTTGTSGVLRYNVSPGAITQAGTYEANIVITPSGPGGAGAPAVRVPIRYVVTGTASVTATPARIEATQTGSTVPAEQTITLAGPTVSYFVRANQPWIKLTQVSDTIPGTFRVSFDTASQAPGEYSGEIVVTPSGLPELRIPVGLRVVTNANLQVNPETVTLRYAQGATTPVTQAVTVTSSGVALPITATASTETGGNWLSVTPASGNTGASGTPGVAIQVSADPRSLNPGTYRGTVRIASTNAANSPRNIQVTLTVTPPAVPTGVVITNSASGITRGIAPGEIITLKGQNMAPSTGLFARVVEGIVQSELGNVSVEFDGIRAPLTYVGPSGDRQGDQINAIVPYQIAGRVTTRLVVVNNGQRSEPIELRVQDSNPGIFTASATGSGQGAILNQDNSVNSQSNPAVAGSVIQIYATGEGQVTPAGVTGQVIQGSNLRRPLSVVAARINGQPATVEYAGSAPGLVSGALQVNVRIPQNLNVTGTSSVPVEILIGGQASQSGVTVAVRR